MQIKTLGTLREEVGFEAERAFHVLVIISSLSSEQFMDIHMSLNSSYFYNCAKHGLPSIILIRVPQIHTMSSPQRKPDGGNEHTYV